MKNNVMFIFMNDLIIFIMLEVRCRIAFDRQNKVQGKLVILVVYSQYSDSFNLISVLCQLEVGDLAYRPLLLGRVDLLLLYRLELVLSTRGWFCLQKRSILHILPLSPPFDTESRHFFCMFLGLELGLLCMFLM